MQVICVYYFRLSSTAHTTDEQTNKQTDRRTDREKAEHMQITTKNIHKYLLVQYSSSILTYINAIFAHCSKIKLTVT